MKNSKAIPQTGTITLDTLCAHILDDWHFRTRAHDDLRRYYGKLLDLMCQELEVEWHDDRRALRQAWQGTSIARIAGTEPHSGSPSEVWDMTKAGPMPEILATICEAYAGISKPFDGYFEYKKGPRETPILLKHMSGIDGVTEELRKLWQGWLRDMLLIRWPNSVTRTTSWSRLAERGLGDPVHPFDYF